MRGVLQTLHEFGDEGLWTFLLVTVAMAGSAARVAGSAIASSWRSPWQIVPAAFLLACAARFFHYALFDETLLAPRNFSVDLLTTLMFAAFGFQLTRARQMVTQYPWAYEPAGPFWWRPKPR
jgi:hypothetical protein